MSTKKQTRASRTTATDPISGTIEAAQETVETVYHETDKLVAPMRKTVLQRFPIVFLLLVTFGISMVAYGFEAIISYYDFFNDRPWLILVLGLGTLVFTGTLYKKLG